MSNTDQNRTPSTAPRDSTSGNIRVVHRGYLSAPLTRGNDLALETFFSKAMTEIKVQRLAVLAYGSLLAHPGDWLGRNMQQLIRCETPFGVEYLGCAKNGRGGAPTLVRSNSHRRVFGGLIILPQTDAEESLTEVKRRVAERERTTKASQVKDDLDMFGYRVVYSDFAVQFDNPSAATLAKAAIESVTKCYEDGHTFMNGIRYLRDNLEWGVETELSLRYRDAILASTKVDTLEKAEQTLLAAIKVQNPTSTL
jgi:hypothetical protein